MRGFGAAPKPRLPSLRASGPSRRLRPMRQLRHQATAGRVKSDQGASEGGETETVAAAETTATTEAMKATAEGVVAVVEGRIAGDGGHPARRRPARGRRHCLR